MGNINRFVHVGGHTLGKKSRPTHPTEQALDFAQPHKKRKCARVDPKNGQAIEGGIMGSRKQGCGLSGI